MSTSAGKTKDKKGQESGIRGFVVLFFFLGFFVFLIVGWMVFPGLLYSKKNQPIDFNHALHNELVS